MMTPTIMSPKPNRDVQLGYVLNKIILVKSKLIIQIKMEIPNNKIGLYPLMFTILNPIESIMLAVR